MPHLQVADVFGRELRHLRADAEADPGRLFASGQQLRVARIRVDHPRALRVEELHDAERALVLRQRVRGLESDLEMAIARLLVGERFELHEQRRHQVEGGFDRGELAQQRDHPPVILDGVEPHPGKHVLPRRQVLVKRLVHVPQKCDARHTMRPIA